MAPPPKRKRGALTSTDTADAADSLHAGLAAMLNTGELSDFELRCGGHNFKVHKMILAIASPVLKVACTGPFMEATQAYMDMPDDDATYVKAMLNGLYTLEYDDTRDISGVAVEPMLFNMHMYLIADKYDVVSIRCMAHGKLGKNLGMTGTPTGVELSWPDTKVKVFLDMLKHVFNIVHSHRMTELQQYLTRVAVLHLDDLLRYDNDFITLTGDKNFDASFATIFMPLFLQRVKESIHRCEACGRGALLAMNGSNSGREVVPFVCSTHLTPLKRVEGA